MAERIRYYKYHKRYNKIEDLFDPKMFEKAPVVLLEVPSDGTPAAYFLVDQDKKEDFNEVGLMHLGRTFQVPKNAEKITAKEFKRMVA